MAVGEDATLNLYTFGSTRVPSTIGTGRTRTESFRGHPSKSPRRGKVRDKYLSDTGCPRSPRGRGSGRSDFYDRTP